MSEQLSLPFGPVRNRELFSNHWLENRLPLEPEWNELRDEAQAALDSLAELWDEQRDRVEHYGNESGLEYAFIQPVFEILGWKLNYQTFLRGRRPDYALFLDDDALVAALKAGRQSADFWKYPAILADAKAWDISLDRPSGGGKAREYPPQQIEWYLNESQLSFAILTNGQWWRLIPRHHEPDQPRFETYLECDLPKLIDLWAGTRAKGERGLEQMWRVLEVFLRFYLFFSPAGFRIVENRTALVLRAFKGSSEYRLGVGEGLKGRVFEALRICIEGFLAHDANGLNPQEDLPLCREQSFALLYRLLFIMYAEDRGLLPYRTNRTYTENRSLGRHRDEIAATLDRMGERRQDDYAADTTAIWDDLNLLFDLIDCGHKRYGVPAYNGGLFDPDAHPFLAEKAISDRYLARVVDQLGRALDPHPQVRLARVDYRDLAIQHLGSIYEGLLELHPHYATEPMIVVRREGWERSEEETRPEKEGVPRRFEVVARHEPGQVYLLNQKGERRASGSYYTPNQIVDHIVDKAVGPVCQQIHKQLHAEIEKTEATIKGKRGSRRKALQDQLEKLQNDFDDRVLTLRICDPAMGSGHFLLRVCQYLAEEVATNPYTGDPDAAELTGDESTLTYWKRRIVEHCIYGVDLNPVAVELAKLALWLETAAIDQPLTFLDHHLRCGNSLVGADIEAMGALPGAHAQGASLFAAQVQGRLPILLEPLAEIARIPSTSVEQVKEKEKLYRRVFEKVRKPFLTVADVWCGSCFVPREQRPTAALYQSALDALTTPAKLGKLTTEPAMQACLDASRHETVNCFHWQLEFPEVFFDSTGLREGGGFDAIVGNPPWGHAQQLEVLRLLPRYQAVADDHAECFVCLAAWLLARPGGRVGLLLPDTILSPAKSAIRRHMLEAVRSREMMNIGPDWFTSEVRMSTVLWQGEGDSTPAEDYHFASCVLPITLRRSAQADLIPLENAITQVERSVQAAQCLQDPEVAVPLFGSDQAVNILERIWKDTPTLAALCEHGRGVELNKSGLVIQCPKCGEWDAPPLRDDRGGSRDKKCTHCAETYPVTDGTPRRVLVTDEPKDRDPWRPYIDGDCVKRYAQPRIKWIDLSASGVNYKPDALYRSPKVLIRQAGIGINAVLDLDLSAYCPQSVYVYRVLNEYKRRGIDEHILISLLCSRLFHLQVFMSFGEIDSSRAFSKLTHKRLARMRTVAPAAVTAHPRLMCHICKCVEGLSSSQMTHPERLDWDIEACWSLAWQLSEDDVRCVIENFGNVHHSETMEALFPGGISKDSDAWVSTWMKAIERVRRL